MIDHVAARFARDARAALVTHEQQLEQEAAGRDSQPPLSTDDVAALLGRLNHVSAELVQLADLVGKHHLQDTVEREQQKHFVSMVRKDHALASGFKRAFAAFVERHPQYLDAMESDPDLGPYLTAGGFFDKLHAAANGEVQGLDKKIGNEAVRLREVIASLEQTITKTARLHAAHADLKLLREAKARGAPLAELVHHLPSEKLAELHANVSAPLRNAHAATA
ncbi:MAG TPA: hypothetical protein VES65_11295 [Solirubrobacteraceae bacterium]|nr:hypothetical protein [Solirubrobacteraceae bacterium]